MSRTVRWGLSSTPSTPWHMDYRTCTTPSAQAMWASVMPWSPSTAANSWTSSSSPRSSVCLERRCGLMRKGMLLEGKAVFSILDLNNLSLPEPDRWHVWLPLAPWLPGVIRTDTTGKPKRRANTRWKLRFKMWKNLLVNTRHSASWQCHPLTQLSP